MQRGYIKIWRKLEDSGLLQMPNTLCLFMVMLMKAVYKPCKVGLTELERGQLSAGRFQLCEWSGLSEQSVRTSLKHLHDMKILTSKPTNKFTVYTFVNYNLYQDIDVTPNQQTNQQLTNNQPTTNQQLTTEEDINTLSIKNKPILSEYSDEFEKFWQTYPKKTGKGGAYTSWKKQKPPLQVVLKSLEWQTKSEDWTKQGGQFVPMPATYINQRRWEDGGTDSTKPFDVNEFMKKANGL